MSRQSIIMGGIALAAVLAGVLWYQITSQESTARPQPTATPTSIVQAPSITPTPTVDLTPLPTPVVSATPVPPSAKTGAATHLLLTLSTTAALGIFGLRRAFTR